MSVLFRQSGIYLLILMWLTGCAGLQANQDDLQEAMNGFVKALQNQDLKRFVSYFPEQGNWRYIGTIVEPLQMTESNRAELEKDLAERSGWYEVFFDAQGDDTFRDYVLMTKGDAWRLSSLNRFSPPDLPDMWNRVYVQWRREANRWVIDAIAEPSS